MGVSQTDDATKNYVGYPRTEQSFRPLPGVAYPIGSIVKLASLDQQVWPDMKTVALSSVAAAQQLQVGVVSEMWAGFGPAFGFVAPQANARGTFNVDCITMGPHPAILIDQSGAGASAITNETAIIPSRATPGYGAGTAAPLAGLGTAAVAMLPAAGLCSNLTAAALAQATCTDTVAGVPAAGDVLTVNVQIPFLDQAPGVAQIRTVSTAPLTAGQAASVTTAAAQLVAVLNADPVYSKYYVASNAAGVVTHTVVQGATFTVNFAGLVGGISIPVSKFTFTVSGSAMNGAQHTSSAVGGSTIASSGNFAGGAGYKGTIPAMVI